MEYATEILEQSPYAAAFLDIKSGGIDVIYFNHAFKELFPIDLPQPLIDALGKKEEKIEFELNKKPLRAIISYNYGKVVVWIKDNSETLDARKEAEEIAKAKSNFLATMSHEIRSPMQSIYGFLELIADEDVNEHVQEMVATARKSASGLLEILDDILDLAKVEAGKIELDHLEVPLRTLAYGVVECMEIKLMGKKVALIAEVEETVPFVVLGDPTRLRQILLNLTGNAVKFTDKGSITIRVTLKAQHVKAPENGFVLRFEIIDTGIGMSKEVADKLFKPFTQADSSTQRKYGGTGLGLSISQKMVALMGGQIGVDSIPGKGSTFWFEFPTTEASEQNPADLPNLEGLAVLSIEDHPKGAKEIQSSLTHMGADVTSTGTFKEGLELIQKRPFDVVICDQGLPDGAGTDLLKEAAKLRPFMGLILYTVLDDIGIQYTAKTMGAKYLSKPASRAGLGEAIKDAAKKISEFSHDGPRKLLIAEDTLAIQDVLKRQLKKLDIEADFADNGLIALEILQKKEHGILITDLHMPEMDGYQLTLKLREMEEEGNGILEKTRLPIIALTADVQVSQKQSYLAYGFDECLLKPVSIGQLKQMLVRWGVIFDKSAMAEKTITAVSKEEVKKEEEKTLPPALDRAAISEQMGDLDADAIEMLKSFIIMTRPVLEKIRKAFNDENTHILRESSHSLKGSARSACCSYLGDLASEVQNCADNHQKVTEDMITGLEKEFKRAEKEINELKL